ncbi:MAG: DUF4198 domain-containing protein [ANME-2 cluster archaeon]|jgi:hypothetical protein|nr:DUF4198 domain-containing protein [ANME-2 cluster archaeon]
MENKIFIVFAMICVLLGTIGMASAHGTWMEIDTMCVDLDENVEVRITEGHNFIGEGIPPYYLSAELVGPDGSIITLNKTAEDEMYWYSNFEADQVGLYAILGTHEDDNSYKVYTGPGSREDSTSNYSYLEGEVEWDELDKSKWADDWHVVRFAKPYKYLKTFVSTNCNFYGNDNAFEQKFEIIPVDDVSTIGTGDFEFMVLFDGRALPNGTVKLTGTKDRDTTVSAICDENGRAVLPINADGDWLITAGAAGDGDHWDGEYNGDFPHGDNYTGGAIAFVGNTYSTALTLLEIRESSTATMRTKISPQIQFNMNPSYFDFGELDPGDASDVETAVIQNLGSKDLVISVSVVDTSGLYTAGLQIDDTLWSEYEKEILKDNFTSLDLQLHVPGNFVGSGEMMGTIIIWSEAIN